MSERYIGLIRSDLAKYPLPRAVRVTRESETALYGIADEDSAHALVEEEFAHEGFMSTCGLENPPHSMLLSTAILKWIWPTFGDGPVSR